MMVWLPVLVPAIAAIGTGAERTPRTRQHGAAPLPDDLVGQGLNEAQWDRLLMRRGIQFVLDDPGRYLLLSLSRVLDFFEFWPTDTSLLHNVGRLSSFTLFLPFFSYGIVLALRGAGPLRSGADWLRFSATPVAMVLLAAGCVAPAPNFPVYQEGRAFPSRTVPIYVATNVPDRPRVKAAAAEFGRLSGYRFADSSYSDAAAHGIVVVWRGGTAPTFES